MNQEWRMNLARINYALINGVGGHKMDGFGFEV